MISFIGYSNSGKTASIEALVNWLATDSEKGKEYSTCVFKNIHHEKFSIDQPGKNTYRFWKAGADVVVSRSPQETAIMYKWEKDLRSTFDEIQKEMENHLTSRQTEGEQPPEIVFIMEGFREYQGPTVLCAKSIDEVEQQFAQHIVAISGAIGLNKEELLELEAKYEVPYINTLELPERLFNLVLGEQA